MIGSEEVLGKVRTILIKRVGEKLVKEHPDMFSKDFGKNKVSLDELHLTKRLRNRIAGYMVSMLTPSKIPVASGEEKAAFSDDYDTSN